MKGESSKAEEIPFGLKKMPLGWPEMAAGFLGFADFAIENPDIVKAFEEETGVMLASIVNCSPIERMIDDATGRKDEMLRSFLDWLVVNHWGEAQGTGEEGDKQSPQEGQDSR